MEYEFLLAEHLGMTVTRMRAEMGQWEFAHWRGLNSLRKERAARAERRRGRKKR